MTSEEARAPLSAETLVQLETTEDARERNRLALALAETRDPRVSAALVRLILRPDLEDDRGTLIQALSSFDCAPHLHLLVSLVVTGNFEVAHESLHALDGIESEVADTTATYDLLVQAQRGDALEDWRRPLVEDAMALFD